AVTRKPERKGLGRGLSALLGDVDATPSRAAEDSSVQPGSTGGPSPANPTSVPIELIHPNPEQPRRQFSEAELAELALSIGERGVIQPLVVRAHPEKTKEYQIVAGERRWRAAQRAGLHALPVTVRELDDQAVLEIAIVENVQRQDLNPLEEAEGYAQLVERFGYTQEALSRVIGKSRSHLANTMRLNGLPDAVKHHLRDGTLSAGHARALLSAPDPASLVQRVLAQGLNVRQTETLVKASARVEAPGAAASASTSPAKDTDTRLLEGDLSAAIGMRAKLVTHPDGTGELRIRYQNYDDLDRLCEKLTR
ncbi:MAG: ParB/RepB/Spo0J family partition protein, partial [Pseudomonadota bacterium]